MQRKLIGGIVASIVLVVLGVYALSSGQSNQKPATELDKFAKCLSEEGVTMYGLKTCSHCQEQKDKFGDSFKYVDYVECSISKSLCSRKGISSVPTWIIDGKKMVGVQSLEKLASMTDCEYRR